MGGLAYFPDGGHGAVKIIGLCLIAIGILVQIVGIGYRVSASRALRAAGRLAQEQGPTFEELK